MGSLKAASRLLNMFPQTTDESHRMALLSSAAAYRDVISTIAIDFGRLVTLVVTTLDRNLVHDEHPPEKTAPLMSNSE